MGISFSILFKHGPIPKSPTCKNVQSRYVFEFLGTIEQLRAKKLLRIHSD
jgi:hypothetical protein